MVRRLTAVAAGLGVLLCASVSGAQTKGSFGEKGQFIFSADRLIPLMTYTNNKISNNNVNPNTSTTVNGGSFSLLYGANAAAVGGVNGVGNPTYYTFPRLGFDYTIIPNLTVGGDLFLFFTTGGTSSSCQGSQCQSNDTPAGNEWGIAPRAGYILGLTNMLSLWLRGGVSYYNGTISTNASRCNKTDSDSTSAGVFGIDLDPQLVVTPIDHFAFEVGPAFDWGFAGGASNTTPDTPNCGTTTSTSFGYSSLNFGLTAGLFGWF